jgi:hypothetical protein
LANPPVGAGGHVLRLSMATALQISRRLPDWRPVPILWADIAVKISMEPGRATGDERESMLIQMLTRAPAVARILISNNTN